MLLMIDNYDSFTYNIVHYLEELGAPVQVARNDKITINEIKQLAPEKIIISPGPCTPNEAGISLAILDHFAETTPLLGVCLGHQCIGQYYGGKIVRAKRIMHGKTSPVYHDDSPLFQNLSNPFRATRYHSLVIQPASLPACLKQTAWTLTADNQFEEIMAVEHTSLPIYGVQFHPESILSEYGHDLLKNFLLL